MQRSWTCIDAGILIRGLTEPDNTAVQELWRYLLTSSTMLVAPSLIQPESLNGLYRLARAGHKTWESIEEAVYAALTLPIMLHGDAALAHAAYRIAARFSLPAVYDAFYLALAERLDCLLWTTDQRLARHVGDRSQRIRVVGVDSP